MSPAQASVSELAERRAAKPGAVPHPTPEADADQNERDYRALEEAVASGRVTAESGL